MKKHPRSWFISRVEHFINLGILLAVIVLVAAVAISIASSKGNSTYIDRAYAQ